jgi:hypothetical protein
MAIYYVRPDGNDINTGTGPGTIQAWQTITKAIGATGIAPGDTLYIAPGVYRGNFTAGFTNPVNSGQRITISGDPTASQFTGVVAGDVIITNYVSDTSAPFGAITLTIAKDYITFTKIRVQGYNNSTNGTDVIFSGGQQIVTNCVFESLYQTANNTNYAINFGIPQSIPGLTVSNNFIRGGMAVGGTANYTTHTDMNVRIFSNTIISTKGVVGYGVGSYQTDGFQGGIRVYNNVIIATGAGWANSFGNMSSVFKCQIYNNVIYSAGTAIANHSAATIEENYNYLIAPAARVGCNAGANTIVNGRVVLDHDYSRLVGANIFPTFAPAIGSPTRNAGTNSLVSASDMFGVSWLNATTPTIGGIEYSNVSGTGAYNPTERNASAITIAPGSTSQSIELYLGVTGITASAIGLSARYNRTRTADQPITLVARTIADPWVSGGFAEVNASTMPGVYRLDIPNEALASGVDDVTIVVRGASGTNGAVMSIKLSSGGLTSTQTAQAVWNALTSSHTTHGTFGWNSLRADAPSKEGLVTLHQSGGTSRVDADVHAIKNDTDAATYLKGALLHDGTGYVDADIVRISTSTAAANELEGALLHNGTDYIDSNLVGGNSTRVFVGRFDLRQTGSDDVDTIEVFTTDTPSFELQLTDGDGNEVPVTGATLGLRILDVASTVVETGTPTVEYGTGGIVRWTGPGTYLAIGCPAGMYRLFIDRTVSGTTTTFGPLQIKVQAQ